MARSNLELLEEVLQILPENLEKESILENHGDHSYHCFYLKEYIKVVQRKERKREEILTKEKVIPQVRLFQKKCSRRYQIKTSLAI